MRSSDTKSKINGVVIIPSGGEYIYDVKPVYKVNNTDILYCANGVIDTKNQKIEAVYASSNLKKLKQELPENSWVALTVSWFADFENVDQNTQSNWGANFAPLNKCNITPKIEFDVSDLGDAKYTKEWSVAGRTRDDAPCIQQIDFNGTKKLNYGGTPNDAGVQDYLNLIKKDGYKALFYPFLTPDTVHKTWVRYLNLKEADNLYEEFCKDKNAHSLKENSVKIKEQVIDFFTKRDGYNNFILHYADLCKSSVDAFLIGSEMSGLRILLF